MNSRKEFRCSFSIYLMITWFVVNIKKIFLANQPDQ